MGGEKLSQRKQCAIIAEYAEGGTTVRKLAEKYGVSRSLIGTIIKRRNGDDLEKAQKRIWAEAEATTVEYILNKQAEVRRLIDQLLDVSDKEIKETPLRFKMQAVKILTECYLDRAQALESARENATVTPRFNLIFADCSANGAALIDELKAAEEEQRAPHTDRDVDAETEPVRDEEDDDA